MISRLQSQRNTRRNERQIENNTKHNIGPHKGPRLRLKPKRIGKRGEKLSQSRARGFCLVLFLRWNNSRNEPDAILCISFLLSLEPRLESPLISEM